MREKYNLSNFAKSLHENINFSAREMQRRFTTRVTNVHELDFIRVLCRIVILIRCKAGLLLVNMALRTRYFT